MQLQCPNCKAQNRPGAKFCQRCGHALPPAMLQGRYRITDVLGQGGFGAVYLAQDVRLGRDCVVKQMLLPERSAHPTLEAWQAEVDRVRDNFQREAQSLTTLNQPGHASIPEIYDFFAEQSGNYLVMKHIRGEDLAARLNRTRQPIPLTLGIEIARQIVSALEYMHARVDPQTQWPAPVLHRDIKPANIIVDQDNRAWLVDFGLSKAQSWAAPAATARQTTAAGTVGYAPPEQYEGKTEPRSDVYALAATLYHLLTNDDPQDHAFSFPRLDQLPSDVNQLLRRALESDVSRRISSANFRQRIQARVTAAGNAFFWRDGTASNTPEDLADPANRFWSEARDYFRQDRWEKWFAERNRNDVLNIMKSIKQSHAGDPDKALDAFLRQICPTFPQPILRLSSPDLQFGDLPWQTTRTLDLVISNGGGGWLSGRFVKTPIWATPNPDSFATHDRQTIKVTVDAGKLTPETHQQTGSLEIAAGSGSTRISVAVTVPTPQISIVPMRLDLGTEGWSDTLHGTLTVRNTGGSACESTVRCDDVWLDIQPDHFRCEPGQSVPLAAKADVRQMVIGVNQLKVAVNAQAGGWQGVTAAQVIANRGATMARWKYWGPTLDWAALGAFVSVMIFGLIRWSGPNLVRALAFNPIGLLFLSGVAAYAGSVLNALSGPQAELDQRARRFLAVEI